MLCNPDAPYAPTVFLRNWRLELRAGYTPEDELDPRVRVAEYLDSEAPDDVVASLERIATDVLDQTRAGLPEVEGRWSEPTANDRLTQAFAALTGRGMLAAECLGLTLRDGWAYAGMRAPTPRKGVVFFHQQDVLDAMDGASLPIAFGVGGPSPASDTARIAVGDAVVDALTAAGLGTKWTGRPRDRIEVDPFEWRRRRVTTCPPGPPPPPGRARTVPSAARAPWSPPELEDFVQPVRAHYSTDGFDTELAGLMRRAWTVRFGGTRGQVAHMGDPHAFIRAGELARMCPCDGLLNLPPGEAVALWARGAASVHAAAAEPAVVAPTAAVAAPASESVRPWWRFW